MRAPLPARPRLPHVERLLRRVRTAETPLVQVWGWPGSGRSALLESLLEAEGERATALALAEVDGEQALREALDYADQGGARWLVAATCPAERLADAIRWLRPGQRLVFGSRRRISFGDLPCTVVAPQELLLGRSEIAALWRLAAGRDLPDRDCRTVVEATDGWYRPVRLVAEGGQPLGSGGAAELLELDAVRAFVQHEVLGSLESEERELLQSAPVLLGPEIARREPDNQRAMLQRAIEELGLAIEEGGQRRFPRLIAAYLERERARSVSVAAPAAPIVFTRAAPAPTGGAAAYSVSLLGDPEVREKAPGGGAERPLAWRLRRSFKVLAYLASCPGLQAGREELIEAVWPTEGEEKIQNNFHPTLSHLRRTLEGDRRRQLPPPLLLRGDIYRLNPEISWDIDLVEFGGLFERGRERSTREDLEGAFESWRSAWSLYRGPFLQGHYESWVTQRREGAQRQYLDMLRDLGDLCVRLERWGEAMDAYRALLVEDPLQERVHLAVMRLYSREGRRDLVRRQYDRLATLLLEELGVEPLPDTTREYHRMMA
ncbi:MAG TPA: BTAD domain-containing putative transcriptional regulator [Thermoanaerobaculia bacterium]|nr:BTAD domain-containing putative transcriptional regulator [Thermoanaerobaculia bacterium]